MGWHSTGLGAQGARGGGRLPAGTRVLPAQTRAGFSAGISQDCRLAAEVAGGAALGCPREKRGEGKDPGRERRLGERGAGGRPGVELGGCLHFQSPTGVRQHSVGAGATSLPVSQ